MSLATRLLLATLNSGKLQLARQGKDRYGRTLATISIDGRDVGGVLTPQPRRRTADGRWRSPAV